MKIPKQIIFALVFFLIGCGLDRPPLYTEILTPGCIKPMVDYQYKTCHDIKFIVNKKRFLIPKNFETDLASIPKIIWPIVSPAHSSLMRPAIIHDWFYRKNCKFSRFQTDLIFYYMLKNDGISEFSATTMYAAVRIFGWNYYNENYCDKELEELDKKPLNMQVANLYKLGLILKLKK